MNEWTAEEFESYERWHEEQEARGPLAFQPDTMPCYECGEYNEAPPEREVVALGPVVNERQDATQTYKLKCGHTAVAF